MSNCLPCATCLENCDDTFECIDQYITSVINNTINNSFFCTAVTKCVNDNIDDLEFCPIVYDCLKSLPGYTDTGTIFLTSVDNVLTWIDLTSIGSNVVVESGNCIDVSGTGSSIDPLIFDLNTSCFRALFSAGDCLNYNILTGEFSLDEDCVQDLVAITFQDTTTIDFTYDDALGQVIADVIVSPDSGNNLEARATGLYVNTDARPVELDSGGVVTWLQDYDFYVSPANYHINGLPYSSPEAFITLSPADPSLDRFDVIYVDSDQIVKVIEGDPSLTPSQPGLDLGLELGLSSIFVEAGSSSPVDIVTECLYEENAEWTASASDSDINVSSATTPCVGLTSIEASAADNGDYFLLTRVSPETISDTFNIITFRLKPKVDWSNNTTLNLRLKFQFQIAGTPVGSAVYLGDGAFNFNSTTLSCQIISIPIIQFTLPITTVIDALKVTVISEYVTSPSFGFFIDGLCMQGGIFGATESDDIHNQYFGPQTPGRFYIAGNGRADGWFTSPDILTGGSGSEKFGWGSRVTGSTGTAIGFLAQANGQAGAVAVGNQAVANIGVAIGFGAQSNNGISIGGSQTGSGGVAVGGGAGSSGLGSIALGGGSTSSGVGTIALGYGSNGGGPYGGIAIGSAASVTGTHAVAFGTGAVANTIYDFVVGGTDPYSDFGYRNFYWGSGKTSFVPANRFWTISGALGTDIAGDKWTFAGAAGTGAAASGILEWQTSDPITSGSTLQSWSTKMALNSNTKGLYLDNIRFQMDEGDDIVAAGNLSPGVGNYFTVTGSTTINAISNTNWQDGAVIYLLFTSSPTLKHNTAGGAGTSPIRLAGAVDFAATPNTVLALGYKDGYWREVGRTQSSAIGPYTFLNGLHEELGGLVKLGGTIIENTTVTLGSNNLTINEGAGNLFLTNLDNTSTANVLYYNSGTGKVTYGATPVSLLFARTDASNATGAGMFFDNANQDMEWANVTTMELNATTFTVSSNVNSLTRIQSNTLSTDLLSPTNSSYITIADTDITAQAGNNILLSVVGSLLLQGLGTGSATDDILVQRSSVASQAVATVPASTFQLAMTADNGLTKNTATNVQLGGTLLKNTAVNTAGFTTTWTGTNNSAASFKAINNGSNSGLEGQSSTGTGVLGTSTDSYGVSGFSQNGVGVYGVTNSDFLPGVQGFSQGGYGGDFSTEATSTNDVVAVLNLTRNTHTTATNGIGLSVDMLNQDASGGSYISNQIISKFTEVTHATRTSQLIITGVNSAVTADLFTLSGSGSTRLNKYGINTFANTPTFAAGWDTNGNFVEFAVPQATITADNGLTKNTATNVQLGHSSSGSANSPLLHKTYINTASFETVFYGESATLAGLNAFNASGGIGFSSITSSGTGVYSQSNSGILFHGIMTNSAQNTVKEVVKLDRQTTGGGGVGQAGIGLSIGFYTQTSTTATLLSNEIISKFTTATHGSQTSQFKVTGVLSASTVDVFTANGDGSWDIRPITATAASAITPSEGKFVFVSDTNGTFTTIGIWCYQNGAWKAL